MGAGSIDHLVLGSTPLAGLLAGVLAASHGKRVCLVGEPFSPFRLQRNLGVSIMPVTRPETLILLKQSAAETVRLVNSWGKGFLTRADALFVGESSGSFAALGHFRQLAMALGYAVEPVADRSFSDGVLYRVRDAQLIGHGSFEPQLETWLAGLGVTHLDAADVQVSLRKDGSARILHAGQTLEADQAVLAGDNAIAHHLDAESLDRSLEIVPTASVLLEGGRPLPSPFVGFLDRGVMLEQDGRVAISALGSGDPVTAHARLGSAVARAGTLRLAGETRLSAVRTLDGAPYIGPARGSRVVLVAGLGMAAPFYAPALARHLDGSSPPDEASWFAARGPTRGNLRQLVSDYSVVLA